MRDRLSALITGAAAKRLTAVEALPSRSRQHEFNGVRDLKALFGSTKARFKTRFVYLAEEEDQILSADGFVTWYDSRASHSTRSEYRLYFPRTEVSEQIRENDLAFLLRRPDGTVLVVFAARNSTAEQQLLWLFDLSAPQRKFQIRDVGRHDSEVGFAAREILDALGIQTRVAPEYDDAHLERLLAHFGGGFPTTAEFSAFARDTTDDVDPRLDPDGCLIAWLEREEALFRQLERHLVLQRLREGFKEDVAGFISFSLSVQNRRKSRVGFAVENHLEAIFRENGLNYSRGQVTERSSRPDFVFPSIEAYRDPGFPAGRLHVLAVKSTCKDRWRQVLAEADRVRTKYLLTLEPGISSAQTKEMKARRVTLVIPVSLHETFTREQRRDLLTLTQFLKRLKAVQSG